MIIILIFLKYKAKLLEKTEADEANGVLKNASNCYAIKMFK